MLCLLLNVIYSLSNIFKQKISTAQFKVKQSIALDLAGDLEKVPIRQ